MSGKYAEELCRAPEDVLSFNEAVNEVDFSYLHFQRTYLIAVSGSASRVHYGRAYCQRSMAHPYRSRISREFQPYTDTCSLNHSQLVRNLPNILGGMQEELELAFEDELILEGHGSILPIFDGCY